MSASSWSVAATAACMALLVACSGDDDAPPPVSFDSGCRDCMAAPPPATCPDGQTTCGSACVDPLTDPAHCGSCGSSCGAGNPCVGGTCRCAGGQSLCTNPSGAQTCADTTSDTSHCGTCGNRCAAGASCSAGVCACDAGEVACEAVDGRATCVSLQTSVLHCGGCGQQCPPTFDCVGGVCACASDRARCSGPERCADLASDTSHCGACGNACASGQICVEGRCVGACSAGDVCTSASDCRTGAPAELPATAGAACLVETHESVSVGDVSWEESRNLGGYCLGALGYEGSAGVCERFIDRGCEPCARCVVFGRDPTMGELRGCRQRCEIGDDWASTRSGCTERSACEIVTETCDSACSSDEQCRNTWRDFDGDGMHDDGESAYDPSSTARCDPASGRCVDLPFNPAARAGDPCTEASDCGQDGYCIPNWPGGGYCTKLACIVDGRECGASEVCNPSTIHRLGGCTRPCVVGDEADPAAIMGEGGGDPDCGRPGYACVAIGGAAFGGCSLGNYNDVAEPNLGMACDSPAQCWSPYGLGACATSFGARYCVVTSCAASPFGHDGGTRSELCPEGTLCVGDPRAYSHCLRTCDPAMASADCPSGHVCTMMGDPRAPVCYPRCRDDIDCTDSRYQCVEGICTRTM